MTWFRKAALQGTASAQNNLATMYENGFGVAASPTDALAWYTMAASQGNVDAKKNLVAMQGANDDAAVFGDKISSKLNPTQPLPLGLPDLRKQIFVKKGQAICKEAGKLLAFSARLQSASADRRLRERFIEVMAPVHGCTVAPVDTAVVLLRTREADESLRQKILKYASISWANSNGGGGFGYVMITSLR